MDIYTSGFRKYEIIKLLNDIKKTIKRIEESVPTQIDNAINQLLDGAPEALDTLKELADALGNNPDIITELNNKIDSINTKKDWNQNDEDADDYIENRTHYLEEGKYIFYKPNATSFNSSDRISLDDALDILNGIDNTYLTRSVIVRNISTSYSTHHKEKCQLIVTDGYLYLNTQYNNSNNDYIDFYNLNDVANRIKSINEEVTYNDIKTLLNNNSMTFNGNTNYFEKSDDIYHKLDINYIPDNINDSIILKETTIPSGGFESNRFYELGEITQDTTFTLKTPTNNNILNKYIIQFLIGSTVPNITWPSNIKWENGSAPTINANKEYLLKIINNLAQIKEF